MADKPRNLSFSNRGLNFEMFMWLMTRLTALAMYALILVAIVGALIMGARTQMNFADILRWAFMPNATHVQSTDVPDLAPWSTPFWKLVGSALLLVASAHGVHGLVVILDDYFAQPRVRLIVRYISIVTLLAVSAMGIYVIWTS
jgi:succinate dehydrogenase hydrophobic anchor subunit